MKLSTELLKAFTDATKTLPADYDALQLYQAVYRNEQLPIMIRMMAAKEALPYERAKPSAGTDNSIERVADMMRAAADALDGKLSAYARSREATGDHGEPVH